MIRWYQRRSVILCLCFPDSDSLCLLRKPLLYVLIVIINSRLRAVNFLLTQILPLPAWAAIGGLIGWDFYSAVIQRVRSPPFQLFPSPLFSSLLLSDLNRMEQ